MSKEQNINAGYLLPKLDREAILKVIGESSAVENFLVSPAQKEELQQRLTDIDNNKVELVRGQQFMDKLALKHGF